MKTEIRLETKNTIWYQQRSRGTNILSGKIDKWEYTTGKGILPSNQSQMIKQVNFKNVPFKKAS